MPHLTSRQWLSSLLWALSGPCLGFLAACSGQASGGLQGGNAGRGGSATGGNTGQAAPVVVSDLSTAALSEMCKTPTWGSTRVWRLSREQLRNSLQDAFQIAPSDAQLGAFNDGAGLVFGNDAATLRIRKADANS